MNELENIELDLLFRVDFFALTNFGDDGYTDDNTFEDEKINLKSNFEFKQYYQREHQGHEYVRLSDVEDENKPYIEYLRKLENINLFECCELEQAIGVFQNGELMAFLSTDTGICYDSPSHFKAIENFLNSEDIGFFDVNTFFGNINGQNFELYYSARSNNIDPDNTKDIVFFKIESGFFRTELSDLKQRVNQFFEKFKPELKSNLKSIENKKFVDEVLKKIE